MPDYAVFGGRLRSALALDGLPPLPDGRPAAWRLTVASAPPAEPPSPPLGEQVEAGLRTRLWAVEGGWRLAYDDTGSYDVSSCGGRITWHPAPGAPAELVQADVLGRVLALALDAGGCLTLHGSAVALAGGGVVFLAPKHHGKSTLAASLAAAGGRLVSDDMAAVEPGPPARLRPGVPSLRLWGDAAAHLRQAGLGGEAHEGIKVTLAGLAPERVEAETLPLAALYLLVPVEAGEGPPARRVPLSPTEGALALVAHAKLGPLLGGALAAAHLARAARVARSVPVYALEVSRGLDLLPRVAREIAGWHAAPHPAAP